VSQPVAPVGAPGVDQGGGDGREERGAGNDGDRGNSGGGNGKKKGQNG
jgi:hypothetical protein